MIRRICIIVLLMAVICEASELRAADLDTLRDSLKLYPVDEAHKNSSFAEFREQLKGAIASKDTSFLLACISENISLGPDKARLKEWSIKSAMKSMHVDSLKARENLTLTSMKLISAE